MSNADVRGRFVWHELMTTDPGAASAFYQRVTGWSSQPSQHDASYTEWKAGREPIGGMMALPEEVRAAGAPPHWMAYIATPDIEETVAQARQLGANVLKNVTRIEHVGRFAVLADPQGAPFAVYTSDSPHQADLNAPPKIGQFSWHELMTTDFEAAFRFYSELFGWEESARHDMGPMGIYLLFSCGGRQVGGMFNAPPDVQAPPNWCGYVRVESADRAATEATAAGGQVINGPMEVPGGDRIAQLVDPQGAMFAVHAVKVQASARPAPKRAKSKPKKPASAAAAPAAEPESAAASPARRSARKSATRSAGKTAARRAKKKAARKAAGRSAAAKRGKTARKAGSRKRPAAKRTSRSTRQAARKRAAGKKKSTATRKKKVARKGKAASRAKSAAPARRSAARKHR